LSVAVAVAVACCPVYQMAAAAVVVRVVTELLARNPYLQVAIQ
jgi:hypothetical protein